MAAIARWLIDHGLVLWVVAQFLFDVVALVWILNAGQIFRVHQRVLTLLVRRL